MHQDILTLYHAVQNLPGLDEPPDELPEFLYGHLSQCIISAVFSLNNNAYSERYTVARYVDHARLYPAYRPGRQIYLPTHLQQPLVDFQRQIEAYGEPLFASAVLKNKQRTSTMFGLLKAEAVYAYAVILSAFGVRYLEDVATVMDNPEFEASIRGIPGQRSGISLTYFYMMAGSERHVKPDRMVTRYLERTLNRKVHEREVQDLVTGAAYLLDQVYPHITPRMLDNIIWLFESQRSR